MRIRDAYKFERCGDHDRQAPPATVAITVGAVTVPLCGPCLAFFWREMSARLDDVGELARKINKPPDLKPFNPDDVG